MAENKTDPKAEPSKAESAKESAKPEAKGGPDAMDAIKEMAAKEKVVRPPIGAAPKATKHLQDLAKRAPNEPCLLQVTGPGAVCVSGRLLEPGAEFEATAKIAAKLADRVTLV